LLAAVVERVVRPANTAAVVVVPAVSSLEL
jgi:hypothetical protein